MSYFIRLLTPKQQRPNLRAIVESCARSEDRMIRIVEDDDVLSVMYGDDELNDDEGDEIVVIERLPVVPDAEGESEMKEFIEEARMGKPESVADWLLAYLQKVKTIYRFEIFEPTKEDWELIHAIEGSLHEAVGGITQADLEGFSNEDGYHILWQFSERVSGLWKMAVLDVNGRWIPFEMDLGDPAHRNAFLQGTVPSGASLI